MGELGRGKRHWVKLWEVEEEDDSESGGGGGGGEG